MTYPNLKPCPKCSADMDLWSYDNWIGAISSWRAECPKCNHIGSCEGTKLAAIREHNRRAAEASPAAPSATGAEPVAAATPKGEPEQKDQS